ncbi:MAG: CHASE2 domain-containing protein [Alphaproteobacteria bacterium]|nr:CHASE2 domain-containing protein [Alphaproteobacteria bacterium]
MIDQLVTSHRSQVSFLIALLVIATTALLFQPEFVKKIHQYSFDSYNRILHRKNDNKVVILSLDQASHQHMGVWPPPRDMWGDIIETITQMGAKAVVFDFIFMHPERAAMPEGKSMPPLADMPEGTSYYDAYFAHKIHGSKKVALPFLTARLDREQIPVRKMDIIYHGGSRGNLSRYFYANQHYIGSIPVLVNAAAGTGHANFVTESDGILRRCPIMMGRTNADNQVVDLYPALSLEVIRVAEGITTPYHVTGSPTGGIESVSFGPYTIPTDMYGRARIYYAGRQGREYISLREVIQGKVDRSHIDGKIVYIGAISENMGDVKPSPLDPVMRGVEAHAEITEQILSGKFLHRTDVMMAGEIIIMLGTTLAVIFFVQRMHTLVMVASVGLLVVLEMLAGFLAFQYKGWLFDPLCPAIITTIIFMLAAILDALRTKIVSN